MFKGPLNKLSEQQLVDCSTDGGNAGCGGGMSYDGYAYYKTHRPMSEASYPYTAKNGVCNYNASIAYAVNTTGYVSVPQDDIEQMKAAVSQQPVNVSIYASATSFRQYSSGIYNDPLCGNQHNHATNVVGWGVGTAEQPEYWIMRNSWGTDWGEQGYMRMEIVPGDGQCGVQMWAIYPTLA